MRKGKDMNTQTDYTLSDIENFEVYKDWYVNECWTAFANFAKFRKDILKEVKAEYITKNKAVKISKRKESLKRCKTSYKSLMSPLSSKRKKQGEISEVGINSTDKNYSEAFLRNSLQKTWEIVIKTNRVGWKVKRAKQHSFTDTFQEFSCQAYMQVPK